MIQEPVVKQNLQRELVGPVPRRGDAPRHDSGEFRRGGAEPVVRDGAAAPAPGVGVVAGVDQVLVERRREVVDVDSAKRTVCGGGWLGFGGWEKGRG